MAARVRIHAAQLVTPPTGGARVRIIAADVETPATAPTVARVRIFGVEVGEGTMPAGASEWQRVGGSWVPRATTVRQSAAWL